jgi:hypothetical protein
MDEYAEEFALGLLDGAERAAVVAHLEECRACGTRVALLAEAGEHLLLIAPEVEPPVGFEQRVMTELGLAQPNLEVVSIPTPEPIKERRGRRWLVTAAGIAAASLLVLGAAVVAQRIAGPASPDLDTPSQQAAPMMSAHRPDELGEAVLVASDPAIVELDMAAWFADVEKWPHPPEGPWSLVVEHTDGTTEEHPLANSDDPTPQIALEAEAAAISSVSVASGGGHIWCTASFE